MIDLIVCTARLGDRVHGLMLGAQKAGTRISQQYGVTAQQVSGNGVVADDDWTDSLNEAFPTLTTMADVTRASLASNALTVVAANTCSVSIGTLPVAAEVYPNLAVVWIDAHGDFNTPASTKSGYLGGMALAAACGMWDSGHGAGIEASRTVLVGARDIDADEASLLSAANVVVIKPDHATPERVLSELGGRPLWIHIDWDVLEPGFVPADYQVAGGLSPDRVRDILSALCANHIVGLEITEFRAEDEAESYNEELGFIMHTIEPVLKAYAGR